MARDLPIACSLTGAEAADRGDEIGELARRALLNRERCDGHISLTFRPEAADAVRELARRESECCPFFTIEVVERGGEVRLDIAAPADAEPILDAFYAAAAPA